MINRVLCSFVYEKMFKSYLSKGFSYMVKNMHLKNVHL
jgi:hypothetical protein